MWLKLPTKVDAFVRITMKMKAAFKPANVIYKIYPDKYGVLNHEKFGSGLLEPAQFLGVIWSRERKPSRGLLFYQPLPLSKGTTVEHNVSVGRKLFYMAYK